VRFFGVIRSALALALLGASCGKPVNLEGKACPCAVAAGYVCCEITNECVPTGGACAEARANNSDGGAEVDAGVPAPRVPFPRLLYAGAAVEDPRWVRMDTEGWLKFSVRRSAVAAAPGSSDGILDAHVIKSTDPASDKVIFSGRSDRPEWPVLSDAYGAEFYVAQTRTQPVPAGTLSRVSFAAAVFGKGSVDSIADVMSYQLFENRNAFTYSKYVEGSPLPQLHWRDIAGPDRDLGPAIGQIRQIGEQTLYFIAGTDHALTQITGFSGPATPLRPRVSRFEIGPGQTHAVAVVTDELSPHTVVMDLTAKTERLLPVANPCCWLDMTADTFTFAEEAQSGSPAKLHRYAFATGVDDVLTLPAGMMDVVGVTARPAHEGESLLLDSHGHLTSFRVTPTSATDLLPFRATNPSFSADGSKLFFEIPADTPVPMTSAGARPGELYVADADRWSEPPRRLTPPGTQIAGFWGHVMRGGNKMMVWVAAGAGGAADVYIVDLETGAAQRIAERAGPISVVDTQLLGVVNVNADMVGDLVLRDLTTGLDLMKEPDVAAFELNGANLAFVVRGRATAAGTATEDGLWVGVAPPFDPRLPSGR
jgi:hypothetical protein